jgi:thymidylate synthase
MNKADKYMYEAIDNILDNGYLDENPRPKYTDGTPAHTYSVNHVVRKYDLSKGEFPICTLRPIAWKTGIKEIFTIYQKPTNVISEMKELGVNWWDEWDIGDGTIGQRYGATVKRYDLINNLIKDIQEDPYGRRKVMSLWQESDLKETDGLAPCAFLTIWNVRNNKVTGKEYLDMCLVQRSGDMLTASGAGCINEVQYAALLMMIARHTGYEAGVFTHFVANEQIYDRHVDQAIEIGNRYRNGIGKVLMDYFKGDEEAYYSLCAEYSKFPNLILNPDKTNFFEMTIDDFEMMNYNPIKPQISLPLGI